MICGIPQGSVLGAILFLLYGGDLQRIIEKHGLCPHLYADDSQIYGSCRPPAYLELQTRMSACIDDVSDWMRSNRLQLNSTKTEILWSASSRRQHQLPQTTLRVGSDQVTPSVVVRDLGILLDADVSMKSHVKRTVSTCFFVLRQLRSIRRSVSRPVLQSLVVSLVFSRLDYGNATLIGIPQHLLKRLQSVMNAAARLIYSSPRFTHITPLLRQLHWLKAKERIDFKVAVLVFKCLHGTAPSYLADELCRSEDVQGRSRLRSASASQLVVRRTNRSTLGDRSFLVAGPRLWNTLPQLVTSASSLRIFKSLLKTHLFSSSFR
jgi:Reverse transcriptase (RNA-dependent DNA polymerase)